MLVSHLRTTAIASVAAVCSLAAVSGTSATKVGRDAIVATGGEFTTVGSKDGFSAGLPVAGIAASASFHEIAGFWFWSTGSPAGAPPDPPALGETDLRVLGAQPAPSVQFMLIAGSEFGGGKEASIRIFDVAGALVATLHSGRIESGTYSFSWHGMGSHGRAVGAGVYFARLEAGRTTTTRRFVVLR